MSVRTNLGGAVLATTLMMGLSGGAQAIKPGTEPPTCDDVLVGVACSVELDALCAAIDDSGAPLKQRDIDTMISKVVGASVKIDQGKLIQAGEKLGDIQSKLDQLTGAPKAKIAEADADAIQAALNAAELCVDGL